MQRVVRNDVFVKANTKGGGGVVELQSAWFHLLTVDILLLLAEMLHHERFM